MSVPADYDCRITVDPSEVHVLAFGAADLRFHEGNFVGRDFPTNTPTHLRVDLWDGAELVPAGRRLAVVVSYGEGFPGGQGRLGQPYYGGMTIHSDGGVTASQVVLPIVQGTLGGAKPTLNYPPRPFIPPVP